jgi:hypothetical protein
MGSHCPAKYVESRWTAMINLFTSYSVCTNRAASMKEVKGLKSYSSVTCSNPFRVCSRHGLASNKRKSSFEKIKLSQVRKFHKQFSNPAYF